MMFSIWTLDKGGNGYTFVSYFPCVVLETPDGAYYAPVLIFSDLYLVFLWYLLYILVLNIYKSNLAVLFGIQYPNNKGNINWID